VFWKFDCDSVLLFQMGNELVDSCYYRFLGAVDQEIDLYEARIFVFDE